MNKLQTTNHKLLTSRKGVVIILVLLIMVVLVAVTSAFLYMTSTRTRASGYDIGSARALWLAEAGMQHVLYRLKTESGYRDTPTTVSGNLNPEPGSYTVTVAKAVNTYTLTSTGTVSALIRTIRQSIVVNSAGVSDKAFNYGVFGNTSSHTLNINGNVVISGDLYYNGDVKVAKDAAITGGLVYADSVSGKGTYTAAPGPPDPVPTYPAFVTTWYDGKITTAENQNPGNWKLEGSSSYNLNGGTVYYKDIMIKDTATITGTGTIVATGDVTIQNSANISQNVTIIAKTNMTVKNNAIIQSGTVLYARGNLVLSDSANVTGSLIAPTSGKKITMNDTSSLSGIIYADTINLAGHAVVSGSVVTNDFEGNNIDGNVHVTFNQSSIPVSAPPGLASGGTVSPQKDWDEIAA